MPDPVTDAYTGGAGSPLVLFHGLNSSWRIWRPVLSSLEAEHAVFAPTLIGHRGGPALAPGPNGISVIADDMERRFDAAGLDRAHLVGNSLGGWLACELAARGRATSVVAFAPAGSWTNPRDLRRIARLLKLAQRSAGRPSVDRLMAKPKVRKALLRSAMERGDLVSGAELEGMSADLVACTVLDGLLASLRTTGPVRTHAIPSDCPVLVAWPDKDRTIPYQRYGVPFVAGVSHAQLVRLPGVGHIPMYDSPALVVGTVLDHIRRVEAASGRLPSSPASTRPKQTEEH